MNKLTNFKSKFLIYAKLALISLVGLLSVGDANTDYVTTILLSTFTSITGYFGTGLGYIFGLDNTNSIVWSIFNFLPYVGSNGIDPTSFIWMSAGCGAIALVWYWNNA